jgi:hypothetical protein
MSEIWPDDVKRIKDTMDLHAIGKGRGYIAFSLQTGKPYTMEPQPSRAMARRIAEKKTTDALLIIEIQPDGMPYNEASAVLKYERTMYEMGYRTPDVFEDEQNSGLLSMPRTKQDRKRMAKQLLSGRPLVPNGVPYGNIPNMKGR